VIVVKLKSKKKPRKGDVWVSEISVKDRNVTPALRRLIALVRRYEDLS
jgi:hypothetical protein